MFSREQILDLTSKPVFHEADPEVLMNPSKEMQEAFVGTSFETTYTEGSSFLSYVFENSLGTKESYAGARILDFGCGWGRMLRLLLSNKRFKDSELYGCDPMARGIELCRRTLPGVTLTTSRPMPPFCFADSWFDLVYAYSVFSHLGESCHLAWAKELARVVKPGGYVCLTTQSRRFIDVCQQFRDGRQVVNCTWHENLARAFTESNCEAKYDQGKLVFSATGGAGIDESLYGEAVVPPSYFTKQWGKVGFSLVKWHEPGNDFGQNIAVLKRTSRWGT